MMRKDLKKMMVTSLSLIAFAGSANAAHRDNSVSVGANVMYTDFASNGFMMKDRVSTGLSLGYDLNANNSFEMTANWLHTRRDDGSNKREDGGLLLLDYVHHFNADGAIQPIVFAGPGYMHLKNATQPTDTFNVNYGAGVEWFMTENVALRVEARDVYTPRKRLHMGLYGASLVYVIGGSDERNAPSQALFDKAYANEATKASPYSAVDESETLAAEQNWKPVAMVAKKTCIKPQTEDANMHINFEHNSSQLTVMGKSKLDKLANCLASSPNEKVLLKGYASQPGAESYNLTMSQKRANAAKAYLASKGVAATRLSLKGFGAHDFVDSHVDKHAQAKNRRVEITAKG